jgi:HEAT repeat protein
LTELETVVDELLLAADYLKSRGQLPLASTDLDGARNRFLDASLGDRERLRALQTLRRNGRLNDELAGQALIWLQSATNAGTRQNLLQQLDGVTNAAFKQPFIELASRDQSSGVREEAVDNLRRFINDPQVETLLWDRLRNDPDADVRQEAESALGEGPFTEARLTGLQQRALNPEASLDERLAVLRIMEDAEVNPAAVAPAFAQLAMNSADSQERLKLFRVFDDVSDPAFKVPLVYGLQDPNPLVREQAVDALSGFRSDPDVAKWLHYVSQNDTDSQVRREAFEVLSDD